jgi:hypothetical protein
MGEETVQNLRGIIPHFEVDGWLKEPLNKSQSAEDSRVFSKARSAEGGLIQTFLNTLL